MAVEVIQQRWCDWHMRVGVDGEPGERVEAVEYQVAFTPSAHSAEPLTVDLCEPCMRRFGDPIMELVSTLSLKKQGQRTSTADPLTKKQKSYKGPRKDGTPRASQVFHPCPVGGGCEYKGVPSSMKNHVISRHGIALGQVAYRQGVVLEGGPIWYVCADHAEAEGGPYGFAKPQALIQHRLQGHGDEPPVVAEMYRVSGQPAPVAHDGGLSISRVG